MVLDLLKTFLGLRTKWLSYFCFISRDFLTKETDELLLKCEAIK